MKMRHFYFISFLFIFLVSCEKEETPNSEIPEWLEPRIEELENSKLCWGCSITRYTYHNEFYYNIYCGYMSCFFCELYDDNGELVCEDFDFEDFIANKKDEVIIWGCSILNKT